MNRIHWQVVLAGIGVGLLAVAAEAGLSTDKNWGLPYTVSQIFGYSLAMGDVNGDGYMDLAVGYRNNAGDAFYGRVALFCGASNGLVTATTNWIKDGPVLRARFGKAVAMGDVNGDGYADLIVGAPGYSGIITQGQVFVYHGSSTGLSATTTNWIGTGAANNDYFGRTLAAGDVNGDGYDDLLVSAAGQGRACLFYGSAAGLSATSAWDVAGFSLYNNDHAINDVNIVGDVNGDGYNDAGIGEAAYATNRGRANIFFGSSTGLAATANWSLLGPITNSYCGSISAAGDVNGDGYADVAVGAWNTNTVYVFHGSTGGPGAVADWTMFSPNAAQFGRMMAGGDINGDGYADLVVAAPAYATQHGRAYLYLGSSAGLGATNIWVATGEDSRAWFGLALALGDVYGSGYAELAAGAYGYDCDSFVGRVYLYKGAAGFTGMQYSNLMVQGASGDKLGIAVGPAGDVNGDGYDDLIVGASGYGSQTNGRAYAYYGSATGISTVASWTVDGPAGGSFGRSVRGAGDVNGDGYADVIIGANSYNANRGRAYIYMGSAAGLQTNAAWTVTGEAGILYYGFAVSGAGDVNGDGFADVIVGAPNYDNSANTGKAYVYHGAAAGVSTAAVWTTSFDGYYGYSVRGGDVNGDGYADAIVGRHGWNSSAGVVYIYHGSATGLVPAVTTQLNAEASQYGYSSGAGDMNGDGYADVIVGQPYYGSQWGAFSVNYGSAAGISTNSRTFKTYSALYRMGHSVDAAGDVDGDGYADAIVGLPILNYFEICKGSNAGVSTVVSFGRYGPAAYYGSAMAYVGDLNGDGFADVAAGGYTNNGNAGMFSVFYVYGNESNINGYAKSVAPRQLQASGAPLARWGKTSSARFRLAARAFGPPAPKGRSGLGAILNPVRMEWEVAPGIQGFGGTNVIRGLSAWFDAGTNGVVISEEIKGVMFNQGTPLHWRLRFRYPSAAGHGGLQYSRWFFPVSGGQLEQGFKIGHSRVGTFFMWR